MKHILLLIAVTGWIGTSTAQVTLESYKKASGVDFSQYETFKFFEINVETVPEFEPRKEGLNLFLAEVKRKLENRGMSLGEGEGDADLLINIGVTISTEERTRQTNYTDAPRYVGQRNYHWESEEVVIGEYKEGTVVLDFVDVSAGEMIWQGVVKGVITDKASINDKRIRKGVDKLFKKFPLDPKK